MADQKPVPLAPRNVGFFVIVVGLCGMGYMAWLALDLF